MAKTLFQLEMMYDDVSSFSEGLAVVHEKGQAFHICHDGTQIEALSC